MAAEKVNDSNHCVKGPFANKFPILSIKLKENLTEWSADRLLNITPMDAYYYFFLLEKYFPISIYLFVNTFS